MPRRRSFVRLWLTTYRRLFLGVLVGNVVVVVIGSPGWRIVDGSALPALSGLTLINVTGAVLVRQQVLLNLLYGAVGLGSRDWPLAVRWAISRVHHVGGLHAGFALAATGWLVAFCATAFVTAHRHPGQVSTLTLILCAMLVALTVIVTVGATPAVRARAHDVFEMTHRWGGWTAIAVFWVLTVHLAARGRDVSESIVAALVTDWRTWILAVVTLSVASPWLRLRRVPISVQRPSRHVAIVHVDDRRRPAWSSAVGVSRRPLDQWHAFATITTPGRAGYRLVISRAGDWTGQFIDDPPTHLWLRGVPVSAPMAKAAVLYRRVVYVATGSGIGPLLGQLLAQRVPARLVWSTRDPRRTYGDAFVDEIIAAQPDAVVWDTTRHGSPNLLRLTVDAVADAAAEAVFIVSNKPTTLGLVRDLERRGIPAFGPIWDS